MSGVQLVEANAEADGMRLDRWFKSHFPHLTQGRIEKMCRKGEIRVEGGRVKANTRLETGQTIRIPPLPDERDPERAVAAPKTPTISDEQAYMIRDAVIFEDDAMIVLNKPAGLAVQGGSKTEVHVDGLSSALVKRGPKPRLVHRLDKDTSGILLLAKSGQAAKALTRSFAKRATRKLYWAAVAGQPTPRRGTIGYGLVKQAGHGPHGAGEKMVTVHPDLIEQTPGAQTAQTHYAVVESAGTRTAWVAMVPVTGRTHQLRAHMAALGHPIVGDGKYGTNKQTNEGDGWGAQLGGAISRKLHLHARGITIDHPVRGTPMSFTAPLPEHMAHTWSFLAWDLAADDPFEEMEF